MAGSGKSYLAGLISLLLVDDPNTNILIMRRTLPQLTTPGSMWDTYVDIINQIPEDQRPKVRTKAMEFLFPSGAKVAFRGCELDKNRFDFQGSQMTLIALDEATQFSTKIIEYLMSRLRSKSKYQSRMLLTCNPDFDSIICRWITDAGYLTEDGYPRPEMDGVIKYFIRIDGDYIFGNTPKELTDKYGEKYKPQTFTFISATCEDNPFLDEDYIGWLEGLPDLEKAQLRYGNWYVRPTGDSYFKREYLKTADKIPFGCKWCRSWDKAGTARTNENKNPDFTACIKMGKDKIGNYYLVGDFAPSNYDDVTETFGRFCKTVGERDNLILTQAIYDGDECTVILPQDPGQAGMSEFNNARKPLLEAGFKVQRDPMPNNKSKITRFTPFASVTEQGSVYIVRHTFDNKTYEALMKELERFNGERSTSERHDDWADCIASAFNYLAASKTHVGLDMPTFSGSNNTSSDNTSNGFSAVDNMVSERGSLESLLDTSVPMRDPYINF